VVRNGKVEGLPPKRGRVDDLPKRKLVFGVTIVCPTCKGKGMKRGNICGGCKGYGVIDEGPGNHDPA